MGGGGGANRLHTFSSIGTGYYCDIIMMKLVIVISTTLH